MTAVLFQWSLKNYKQGARRLEKRNYLKKAIQLSDENGFKRIFNITKRINDGGSVICYEAYHDGSIKGILKEFYPKDDISLERRKDGQLIYAEGFDAAREKLKKEMKDYIEPYKALLKIKRENNDLATFIPDFEIYRGLEDGTGTVYIWSSGSEVETFDKICEKIHKYPNVKPEYKLVTVLNAIESLTKCVCLLHSANMLHMDIKPSNFGFIKRNNEVLTQSISLFDINSICSIFNIPENIRMTPEYSEPRAQYKKLNNQTDIYSIGATLFNAIIVTDEVKENSFIYDKKYYNRLQELVDNSKLIQASDSNNHPRLRNILAKILKRSLCERSKRYENCEELLEDINDALYYSLPSKFAKKVRLGEKWILADVKKSLDKNTERNINAAIQYHLYNNPLYKCIGTNENNINVLVIGLGSFSQKFLDICLQVGQIAGKILNVTVVSDNETDKNEYYLKNRPELTNFFNIDNSLENNTDNYGNINFLFKKFSESSKKENEALFKDIIEKNYKKSQLSYVFIAMGDDNLNINAAKACLKVISEMSMPCCINFTLEVKNDKILYKGIIPVYVNEDIKKSKLYYDIERMAFNVHIVWEKDLNINYKKIKERFQKKYNHDSCVSNVLSLKYKLYSVGIDMDKLGFIEAAKKFSEIIKNNNNKELRDNLIWAEHKRWVAEKLCLGWTSIKNLEDCLNGITKDERNKRHICILKSRPGQVLEEQFKANNYEKWDSADENEIKKLDELDLMSLKLHRVYLEKAKKIKNNNLLHKNIISEISSLIRGNKKLTETFNEWYACVNEIWNHNTKKVRLYESLKKKFIDAAKDLGKENEELLKNEIEFFHKFFYPILASVEYRNYKLDDVALVDNIPFILTYTNEIQMVIPYALGNNNDVFGNLSAVTVVNPKKIIYISILESRKDISEFKKTIPYISEYMIKKEFRASIEFVIGYKNIDINDSLKDELVKLSRGIIKKVVLISVSEKRELSDKLIQYLNLSKRSRTVIAVEENNSKVSNLLQGGKFYNKFPCYSFESETMKFKSISNCDMLTYINKAPYISVTDMFAFKLSSGSVGNHPEFYADYKELWNKYTENKDNWKYLCDILSRYVGKNDVIAKFTRKPRTSKVKECRYIIPNASVKNISDVVIKLRDNGFIEADSFINNFTTDSCEVIIKNIYDNDSVCDKMFSKIYLLMAGEIKVKLTNNGFDVKLNNLIVENLQIDPSKYKDIVKLMSFFENKGYIINLIPNNEKNELSFTYATTRIKKLLTVIGDILEVYIYHSAKNIGEFDDVVSNFEVEWERKEADIANLKNEFDCIITKGFETLFIECKMRKKINSDFYYRLSTLAAQFGINAKVILVTDAQENEINNINENLGNQLGIITISNSKEIEDIGKILCKIVSGNYEKNNK